MSANYNPSPHFPRTWNAHKACVSLWFWSIMRQRCHLLNVYIDLEDAPGIVRVVRVLWNSSFNFLGGGWRNRHPSSTTETAFTLARKKGGRGESGRHKTHQSICQKENFVNKWPQRYSVILHRRKVASYPGSSPWEEPALWHHALLYLDLDCNFWQGSCSQTSVVAEALLRLR